MPGALVNLHPHLKEFIMAKHPILLALLLSVAAAGMATAADTSAAPAADTSAAPVAAGVYVGAGVGLRSSYGLDCISGATCDLHTNQSGKLYAGYVFGSRPFFTGEAVRALELMAYAGGAADAGFHTPAGTYLQGAGKFQGMALVNAGYFRIDRWELDPRLGVAYTRGSVDYAQGGSDAHNAFGVTYGIGAGYALDKNWSLHVDWDRVPVKFSDAQRTNVNMFTVGASYHF